MVKLATDRGRQAIILGILFCVISALAVLRVISTHDVFNHTYDEPTHIYAGIQYLDTGHYRTHQETPPLARLLMGVGPYFYGARDAQPPYQGADLDALYNTGSYDRILSLARLGNIPLLLLLFFGTCIFANKLFGMTAAIVSIASLSILSPILGHSGLATIDIGAASTVLLGLYVFMRWTENPTWSWALMLGIIVGIAIMVKLSAITFFASSIAAALLWRPLVSGSQSTSQRNAKRFAKQLSLIVITVIGVIWFAYGFMDPLRTVIIHDKFETGTLHTTLERYAGDQSSIVEITRKILMEWEFPAFVRDFIMGLKSLADHNATGHWNYLFGEVSRDGWWYYYLVELAVKTPIPFLLLGICGLFYVARSSVREKDWRIAMPALCFVAILLTLYGQSNQ